MLKEDLATCIDLRHQLHRHPELSWQETWTKANLLHFLKEKTNVFEIVDRGHYFYAFYQGASDPEASAIAFRADFDALPIEDKIAADYVSQIPGKGHKCGHDGHAATLCGLALEINRLKPERNVVLLFQPAEEVGEGAKACLDIFAECKIDSFYAYHNYPGQPFQTVALNKGTLALTSKGLNLYFKGKPSHAMRPEDGINPSYAMAKLVSALENIQTDHSLFKGMIRLTIVHVAVGEKAFGISAGKGVLRLTIRALYDEDLQHLEDLVVAQAQSLSKQYQLEFSWDSQEYFPATVNHSEAVDKIWQVCQGQGQAIKELEEPFRASEDFAYFLQKVPGAMFFMGDGEDYAPLHTEGFDFPDGLIEPVVEVFYGLIQA